MNNEQGFYVKVSTKGFLAGKGFDGYDKWSFDLRDALRFSEKASDGEYILMPFINEPASDEGWKERANQFESLPEDEKQIVEEMQRLTENAVHHVATPKGLMIMNPYEEPTGAKGVEITFGNGRSIYVQYEPEKEAVGIHIYEDHDSDAASLYVDLFNRNFNLDDLNERIRCFLKNNQTIEAATGVLAGQECNNEISYAGHFYMPFNSNVLSPDEAAKLMEEVAYAIEEKIPHLNISLHHWEHNEF